jgi:hypothetical protein
VSARVSAGDVDRRAESVSEILGVTVRADRAYGGTAVHVVIPGGTATSELMTRGTARDAYTFLGGMLSALDMPRQVARWAEWEARS